MNATIVKFGYPDTLLKSYKHWVLLLRPAQVTLGSLILAAKSDATAFGALDPGAHAELAIITAELETMATKVVDYEKINYLMLMMVDPHVHFHVIPRYNGCRSFGDMSFEDKGWPGPPDLASAIKLDEGARRRVMGFLKDQLVSN